MGEMSNRKKLPTHALFLSSPRSRPMTMRLLPTSTAFSFLSSSYFGDFHCRFPHFCSAYRRLHLTLLLMIFRHEFDRRQNCSKEKKSAIYSCCIYCRMLVNTLWNCSTSSIAIALANLSALPPFRKQERQEPQNVRLPGLRNSHQSSHALPLPYGSPLIGLHRIR